MSDLRTADITDEMIAHQFRWYAPERIILFGSHARREPSADIDIILIKETQDRFLDRLKHVYERWSLPVPADILVYTADEWRQMRERGLGFVERVMREGREIHVRPEG